MHATREDIVYDIMTPKHRLANVVASSLCRFEDYLF